MSDKHQPLTLEQRRQLALATLAHAARARAVQQAANPVTANTAGAEHRALDATIQLALSSWVQPAVFIREVLAVVLDHSPELVDRLGSILAEAVAYAEDGEP